MDQLHQKPELELAFRAIERSDLGQLKIWRNELLKSGVVRQWYWLSMDDQERWFRRIQSRSRDVMLAVSATDLVSLPQPIGTVSAPRLIGVVGLTPIDWVRKHGEVSIYIGDKDYRGTGAGRQALDLLLDYGFGTLGMHRIHAEVYGHNVASLRLFDVAGFAREGVYRQHTFYDGQWYDAVLFGMLEDEWRKIRGRQ